MVGMRNLKKNGLNACLVFDMNVWRILVEPALKRRISRAFVFVSFTYTSTRTCSSNNQYLFISQI